MGQTCSLSKFNADFEVPQLKERNTYGETNDTIDDTMLKTIFPQSYEQNRQSKVLSMIQNNYQQHFQDSKFELSSKQSQRLSILFNYQTNRCCLYNPKQQTDITSFIQPNVDFSYLASVFYLFCNKKAKATMLPKLVQAQEANTYGAYSTNLYCNGQKHQVIVDDRMPTHNDDFLYLRIVKGNQLWPLILEKAWCKQVGSYDRAQGLSPEDAFEEITGIPAYTYTFGANNRPAIKRVLSSAVDKGYWVALIARSGLSELLNRQVFYLESMNGKEYTIISPYINFTLQKSQKKRDGEVVVEQQAIFWHFQGVVVGYHQPNYIAYSIPITSAPRQQLIFELEIANKQEVSIRFSQFYHGYLPTEHRQHYHYTPVIIELYQIKHNGINTNYQLLHTCQGCQRSLTGSKSAHYSPNILQTLQGSYLLRLQAAWQYQNVLNTGNLVIYSSPNNVQITPLKNTGQLIKEVYPSLFSQAASTHIILHEHNLQVTTFDKQNSTLVMFHNVTNHFHHFQVDFRTSVNTRLRGKQVKGHWAHIKLQADQKQIVEVLPQEMKLPMQLSNLYINQVPIK